MVWRLIYPSLEGLKLHYPTTIITNSLLSTTEQARLQKTKSTRNFGRGREV